MFCRVFLFKSTVCSDAVRCPPSGFPVFQRAANYMIRGKVARDILSFVQFNLPLYEEIVLRACCSVGKNNKTVLLLKTQKVHCCYRTRLREKKMLLLLRRGQVKMDTHTCQPSFCLYEFCNIRFYNTVPLRLYQLYGFRKC